MSTSPKYLVDTNIFIYLLFAVDAMKQQRCVQLFEQAEEGEVELWTTEWVIAELVWFLAKQKYSWEKIKEIMLKILATTGLEVRGKKWLLVVLELTEKSIDFVDVINVTLARADGVERVYSYDQGLDGFGFIKREEP